MTFKIYADNKYVETRDDIESCLAIVKYLYENYEIRRIRIERRGEVNEHSNAYRPTYGRP